MKQYGIDFSTLVDGISAHWEMVRDVAVDSQGNIYVTGGSSSIAGISITPGNDYKTSIGTSGLGSSPDTDIFLIKYSPDGQPLWSTRMGGGGYDRAYALELDDNGSVYVAGRAGDGMLTTQGVYQQGFAGDSTPNVSYGEQDGFVAKLNAATGAMDWATFFGGGDAGFIRDLDVGADGTIHLGYTHANTSVLGQPVTNDAMSLVPASNIYAQLSNDGSQLLYGTYLGNAHTGVPSIVVDDQGDVNISFAVGSGNNLVTTGNAIQSTVAGGDDIYVAKFDGSTNARTIKSATFIGGSADEGSETHQLAIDSHGNFYTSTSFTHSTDIILSSNSFQNGNRGRADAYLAAISADGTTLLGSTYFGGSGDDNVEGIVVTDKAVYVSGSTTSDDLAVTDTTVFGNYGGGADGFLAVFSLDLSTLLYASYIGGSGADENRSIAVSANGDIIFGGQTTSTNFDLLNAADARKDGQYAGFLTKLVFANQPPTAVDDTFLGHANGVIGGNVLLNDQDNDAGMLAGILSAVAASFTTSAGGVVDIAADGDFIYHPSAGYVGSDQFTYSIVDGQGGSDSATVNLTIDLFQVNGTAGIDRLNGPLTGSFRLMGYDGNDTLVGSSSGSSMLAGGAGDDSYVIYNAGDVVVENAGEGTDLAYAYVNYTLPNNVDSGHAMITGITLRGNAGGNKLSGAAGNDTFHGAGGDDDLAGNGGNDLLFGDDGLDRLLGHDGNDVLYGGNGNDMLSGGAGNDTIDGGAGNDSIEGGTDADVMTGGTGADLFLYRYGNFGPDILSSMDTITDFSASEGDTISLRLIDAKTDTAADDGFTFIGSQAFQGVAGELRYEATGSGIVAQGDRNGDGVADMAIQLLGVAVISGSNFVL